MASSGIAGNSSPSTMHSPGTGSATAHSVVATAATVVPAAEKPVTSASASSARNAYDFPN